MTRAETDAVLERVKTWPIERQEDAAQVLIRMEDIGTGIYELDEDEKREAEAALARGEVAPAEEVEAFFARYRSL